MHANNDYYKHTVIPPLIHCRLVLTALLRGIGQGSICDRLQPLTSKASDVAKLKAAARRKAVKFFADMVSWLKRKAAASE